VQTMVSSTVPNPAAKLANCFELRQFLIHSVSTRVRPFCRRVGNGRTDHPLHYVFNTPYDRLSGTSGIRRTRTSLDRTPCAAAYDQQDKGLAPFPTRSESEFDTFASATPAPRSVQRWHGHCGCQARRGPPRGGHHRRCALTAGMAFEALNHAGTAPPIADHSQ